MHLLIRNIYGNSTNEGLLKGGRHIKVTPPLVFLPRLASLILSSAEERRARPKQGRQSLLKSQSVGWMDGSSRGAHLEHIKHDVVAVVSVVIAVALPSHSHSHPPSLSVMSFSSACVERLHGTCRGESAPSLSKILMVAFVFRDMEVIKR